VLGSASEYNGAELVQESNNEVVVVVIQYRLGLFGKLCLQYFEFFLLFPQGFLAGQQVKEDGALNAGLRTRFIVSSENSR
jgi:hypothetical protein